MQKEKSRSGHNRQRAEAAKLLDLYIRNNNKQALLIHTPRQASLSHITQLIATRFHVPPNEQILFYNGTQLRVSADESSLEVQDKGILHLVDRRNITENITISVRRLNAGQIEQFRVPASQVIEDFIVRNIYQQQLEEQNRLFFVYTGRELNSRATFAEEFVENRSQLFCLDQVKDEVVGQKRKMYEKKILKKSSKEGDRKESKKEVEYAPPRRRENIEVDTIKEASIQQSLDGSDQPQLIAENSRKEDRDEVKTPNFKKKNMSEEVNLGNDILLPQPAATFENSTSLVTEQLVQNKSSLAPNPFFNEGSSISSICSEENHNPESSKRIDEPSVMFHSAYIGLSNEQHSALVSRTGSIIIAQQEEKEDGPSLNFDNRAPQLISPPLKAETEIMEESKEDYPDSKEELSAQEVTPEHSNNSSPSIAAKEHSKDLSQYDLDSVDNHRLSDSAELDVQNFDKRETPLKQAQKQSDILIEDAQGEEESKTLEYLGEEIEPIAHSSHHMPLDRHSSSHSNQLASSTNSNRLTSSQEDPFVTTPYFDQRPLHMDLFVIEQEEGEQVSGSDVVQDKQERRTNPHSLRSSNFQSSNSSRARHFDATNEYNFGQFERNNRNRFSSALQEHNQTQGQTPSSEIAPPIILTIEPQQGERLEVGKQEKGKKSIDDDHSLNIVQLPIEVRIKENSSLLIDYDSKSDFPDNSHYLNKNPFQEQNSGIDELNKLIEGQKVGSQQGRQPQTVSPPISSSLERQLHKSESDLGMVHHERNHPPEEAIDTSLNLRMSARGAKDSDLGSSPILIKEIKGIIDSTESLEKMEVKNSLPYLNSYSRSVSSEMRFTNHKEVYSIGDFVFNCEVTNFHPLAFFLEALSKQEALDVYRSYP